jgi:bifunctional non-homologous end joining protein LigD
MPNTEERRRGGSRQVEDRPDAAAGWAVEPKLDGWRVLVAVDPALPGGVVVRTRRGHPLTVPGIEALAATGMRAVLDGELVAGAGTASDFYGLLPRLAGGRRNQEEATAVSFWAFDLLWLDDELLVDRPYSERRRMLEELDLAGPCGVVARFPGTDAEALLAACHDHDVEGIVLKRLRSSYRPGRSRHWRKVKVPGWAALHAQRRRPR